jgi:hypothetical protein
MNIGGDSLMKPCRILHWGTGLNVKHDGYIINGRAVIEESVEHHLQLADDCIKYPVVNEMYTKDLVIHGEKNYLPAYYFALLETECENNLVQLEIDGKWGFADTLTGAIVIPPQWDWCGPFYNGYAMVIIECPTEPGIPEPKRDDNYCLPKSARCGFISTHGENVVPFIYTDADCISNNNSQFIVCDTNLRWGVVDNHGEICVPFDWGRIEWNYKASSDRNNVYECWENNRGGESKQYSILIEA